MAHSRFVAEVRERPTPDRINELLINANDLSPLHTRSGVDAVCVIPLLRRAGMVGINEIRCAMQIADPEFDEPEDDADDG